MKADVIESKLVKILEAGRHDFLEAAVPASLQSSGRQVAGSWSAVQCIEHVVIFEERCLRWIQDAPVQQERRDFDKELRLFTAIRSRLTKLRTADALLPAGRFRTAHEALAGFQTVRDRSVGIAQQRGRELYSVSIQHPYFGELNGAELIHLMDGHARRHADQIRELREEIERQGRPRKTTRARKDGYQFQRDAPELPKVFEDASDSDFVRLESRHLQDLERPDLKVDAFRSDSSLFERVKLAGSEFGVLICKDVRFVGCDLSNVRAHQASFVRVELIDCRLTGFHATALAWHDVLIRNGDMRYAQLQSGKFRCCEFEACKWQEADLRSTDLTGSFFRSCDFAQADLRGATLRSADFRTCQVEGMQVEMSDLKGAIVDAAQAMVFARLLGLQIL